MVELDNAVIGAVVKRLRKDKGKSQEVLSGLCGISRSHLSMIEAGRKNVQFETLWRIAFALEISPRTLVGYIEDAHKKAVGSPDAPEVPHNTDSSS